MKYIFIDTSIFIKYNYLSNPIIEILVSVCKNGAVRWLITDIIVNEIINNYNKSQDKLYQTISSRDFSLIKNIDRFKSFTDDFKELDHKQLFKDKLYQVLEDANVIDVSLDIVDINTVITDYFKGNQPFSSIKKDKKSEFPDAINLNALKNYAIQNNINKIQIFSIDTDLTNFEPNIFTIQGSDEFIDYIKNIEFELTEIRHSRLEYLRFLFDEQKPVIRELIKDYVHDLEIDLKSLKRYCSQQNNVEADFNNALVSYFNVSDLDYKVFTGDNDTYLLDIKASGSLEVQLLYDNTDPENSYNFKSIFFDKFPMNIQSEIYISSEDLEDHSEFKIIDYNYGDNLIKFYSFLEIE